MNYKQIADFIIKEVQEKSTGFQYVVSLKEIIKETGVKINSKNVAEMVVETMIELLDRKEVADVTIDRDKDSLIDGFDVVLYTDYAPNYVDDVFLYECWRD